MVKKSNVKTSKKKQTIAIKLSKRMVIAIIAIVLAVAIAIGIIYFGFPSTWKLLIYAFGKNPTPPESGLNFSEGELYIEFVDVGQGDCIIVIFPDGKTLMMDGGDRGYSATVVGAMDRLGITVLDYVVLTHTDADHSGSLDDAIIYAKEVKNIYTPKIRSTNYDFGLGANYLEKSTTVYDRFLEAGHNATYQDGEKVKPSNIIFMENIIVISDENNTYKLTMFCRDDYYYQNMKDSAHDLNDVSPICILEFNDKKIILTGDANNSSVTTSSEKYFLNAMKGLGYTDSTFDADILKVAHHGSSGSSGADFLDFIDCEFAITTVGNDSGSNSTGEYDVYISKNFDDINANYVGYKGNGKYNHPHYVVAGDGQRLESSGIINSFYTNLNGNIVCIIDKEGTIVFTSQFISTASGGIVTFASLNISLVAMTETFSMKIETANFVW